MNSLHQNGSPAACHWLRLQTYLSTYISVCFDHELFSMNFELLHALHQQDVAPYAVAGMVLLLLSVVVMLYFGKDLALIWHLPDHTQYSIFHEDFESCLKSMELVRAEQLACLTLRAFCYIPACRTIVSACIAWHACAPGTHAWYATCWWPAHRTCCCRRTAPRTLITFALWHTCPPPAARNPLPATGHPYQPS